MTDETISLSELCGGVLADEADSDQQLAERLALVASLRERIGEIEQRHHLPAGEK